MVLLISDRRLLAICALTFLALYFGLIPAEEEFLGQKFQQEYAEYCRQVPRLSTAQSMGSGRCRQDTL
jgi:protein-S-isoprenylcysteine O-methyltransferase Ste14